MSVAVGAVVEVIVAVGLGVELGTGLDVAVTVLVGVTVEVAVAIAVGELDGVGVTVVDATWQAGSSKSYNPLPSLSRPVDPNLDSEPLRLHGSVGLLGWALSGVK